LKERIITKVLDVDGLRITTDFETGNGKAIRRLEQNHYQLNVEGDEPGYNYYFGVRVFEQDSESRWITLEILPDPDLDTDFYENLNTRIWYTKQGMDTNDWERFYHLPEFNFEGEDKLDIFRDRYVIRFRTVPKNTVWLTNMYPLPYSMMSRLLEQEANRYGNLITKRSIGNSVEGRDIHLLELGEGTDNDPTVLILAGQHATEFPGQWAVWGIIRWLSSSVPQAKVFRKRYRFYIIPQINPDGNVAGKPQKNEEGINLSSAWESTLDKKEPLGHENRLLWRVILEHPPDIFLNFHGYCGPRAWGDWPNEGCYVPCMEDFVDDGARKRQEILNDQILWHSNAGSQHRQLLTTKDGIHLYSALARFFGTSSICYEPLDSKGIWNNMRTGIDILTTVLETGKQIKPNDEWQE